MNQQLLVNNNNNNNNDNVFTSLEILRLKSLK